MWEEEASISFGVSRRDAGFSKNKPDAVRQSKHIHCKGIILERFTGLYIVLVSICPVEEGLLAVVGNSVTFSIASIKPFGYEVPRFIVP